MSTEIVDMIEQFAEPEHLGNGFYFHGHGMDKNGNHRIKVSKGANRAFSVQTNQEGLFDVHKHYTADKTAKMTEPIKRSILAHMFKWARKTTDPKRDHKEVEPDLKEKQFSEATPKKSDLQFTEFAEPAQYSEEVIKANLSDVKPGTSCTPVGSIIMPVKMRDDSPPVPMQYQEKIEGSQFTIPSVVKNNIQYTEDNPIHENLVEYAVRDLFKGKSLKNTVSSVHKKFNNQNNMFLGGDVKFEKQHLHKAVMDRVANNALNGVNHIKEGMEHMSLGGTADQFNIPGKEIVEYIKQHHMDHPHAAKIISSLQHPNYFDKHLKG